MFLRKELLSRAAAKQLVRRFALKTAHAPDRPRMRGIFARLLALGPLSPLGYFSPNVFFFRKKIGMGGLDITTRIAVDRAIILTTQKRADVINMSYRIALGADAS